MQNNFTIFQSRWKHGSTRCLLIRRNRAGLDEYKPEIFPNLFDGLRHMQVVRIALILMPVHGIVLPIRWTLVTFFCFLKEIDVCISYIYYMHIYHQSWWFPLMILSAALFECVFNCLHLVAGGMPMRKIHTYTYCWLFFGKTSYTWTALRL